MLREMSYTSIPQDEAAGSDRSTFITQGLMEYSPRSAAATVSHQKIYCFIVSLLLFIGASLAIIIPILLDGRVDTGLADADFPQSSHLNNGLSYVSSLFNKVGNNEDDKDNSTLNNVIPSSDANQNKSSADIYKFTTKIEEITTVNPSDDQTWKVVNSGDNIYIVPVHNNNSHSNDTHATNYTDYIVTPNEGNYDVLNNMTIHNTTALLNNTIINGTFIVNDTESSNTTTGNGLIMNITANPNGLENVTKVVHVEEGIAITQLQQQPTTVVNPVQISGPNSSAADHKEDHIGSPWEPYQNNSYSTIQKSSVISSLDNLTLVVLVALIAVSLSTLVAALAFIVHVKMETRKRRRNIANVITDLQSPDKIILLNSDESENSQDSDEEYGRS